MSQISKKILTKKKKKMAHERQQIDLPNIKTFFKATLI